MKEKLGIKEARRYLEQYRFALMELDYFALRIESLEAKLLGTSTAEPWTGWTGEHMRRAKDAIGRITTRDHEETLFRRKESLMPQARSGQKDPKSGEKLIVALLSLMMDYEERALATISLCREIESAIDRCTDGSESLVLKYRFIENLTYEKVAEKMYYSNTTVRRLQDTALKTFALNYFEVQKES